MSLVLLLAALLGAGAGTNTRSTADRRPHLAFVLLETAAIPSGEKVVAAFRAIAPRGGAKLVLAREGDGEAQQFKIGNGGSLVVSLMPVPVPNREADESYAYSFSALLKRDRKLAPHFAHLAVVFLDEPGRSRYDGLVRFTYALAALAEAARATAVYWGDAGATHDARPFIDVARRHDPDLMLPLWCGFEVVPAGADRASVLTVGMRRQLGIMELRVTAPRTGLAGALGAMFDFLALVARRGSAIPAGETIGRSADERLTVRHEPSPVDPEEKVWRVDFP